MLLITAFITFSTLIITAVSRDAFDCQITRALRPCFCRNDVNNANTIQEIVCNDISEPLDLKSISVRLQEEFASSDKSDIIVDRIVINKTSVKFIRSGVFTKIGFRKIEINDNQNLVTIDKTAFDGSIKSAEVINIMNNPRLHNRDSHERDIWEFFSKFPNLRELSLTGSSVHSIPDNAFQSFNGIQNQLRYIRITNNKIESVGDFAFSRINSNFDLILSNNRINKISDNSLKFKKKSKDLLIRSINLSNNSINNESFESQSFTGIGRSIGTLYLRHNSLNTIEQNIFEPLFDRSDKTFFRLEIDSNPIVCNCSLQWIVKTKYCFSEESQSKSALISDQISTIKCGDNRELISADIFKGCPELPEKLSPSCMKSTNSNKSINFNRDNNFYCLSLLNALIVFTLNYV